MHGKNRKQKIAAPFLSQDLYHKQIIASNKRFNPSHDVVYNTSPPESNGRGSVVSAATSFDDYALVDR